MIPKPLQPYAEALKAYEKQAIEIRPKLVSKDLFNDPLKLTQSKFGGKPFLPKDKQYPMDYNSDPMVLVAQINFAELPATRGFPRKGLLQLYVDIYFDYRKDKEYEVLYISADDLKKEPRTDFSFLTWNEDIRDDIQRELYEGQLRYDGIYALEFAKKIDRSGYQDERFDFLFDGKTIEEFIEEFHSEEDMLSKMLNYLEFRGCKINGYAQTESDYSFSYDIVKPHDKDDIQLLQVGWNGNDFNIDDTLNLFINPYDLENKDFEEAYLA